MSNIIKFKTEIDTDLSVTAPVKSRTMDNGGDGGNMEARVAKLESDVEYIKRDISEIKTDIREMKTDLKRIDTIETKMSNAKFWVIGVAVASTTFISFFTWLFANGFLTIVK